MNIWILSPQYLAQIVMMVEAGEITRETGKQLLEGYIAAGLSREVR